MSDTDPLVLGAGRGGLNSRPGGGGRQRGRRTNQQPRFQDFRRDQGFGAFRGEHTRRERGRAASNEANSVPDAHLMLNNAGHLDHNVGNDGTRNPLNLRSATDIAQPTRRDGEAREKVAEERESEAPYVIFTDNGAKKYEDFMDTDFLRSDENLGIKYEQGIILEDTILLLRYNCPDRDCDIACLGWPHLHRHVKQKHGKLMCDLCIRNKKVFTHEHELFTFSELRRHEKAGSDRPGAVNQSGFRGHPECGFCRQRFYGDDELYEHCREKHERCHICDRRNPGSQVQYYLNYAMLEKHFQSDHFVCLDAECQANKTNVFESEIDLKAHQLSSHPNGLSKDARRDARLVNISSFDYRAPYQPRRREGDHRGNGRGRDPNAEPLPISSAQPLRRDELAYQRQMAILNAQPQLIPRNHAASPVPRSPRPEVPDHQVSEMAGLSLDQSSPSSGDQTQTPREQARQVRHTSVLQRASNLLQADTIKLSAFRNHISSYNSSSIGAGELIDAFFSLFDVSSIELGKLMRELADIYEDETKRQDLLKAWNDWLSINADYPNLPGPNATLPGTNSNVNDAHPSGRRVLRLKSSTAQSSRSDMSRQSSWGSVHPNAATSASSPSNPFPALGGAPSLSNGQTKTAWTGTQSSTSTFSKHASPSGRSNQPTSNSNGRGLTFSSAKMPRSNNDEMFPALPTAKKPNTLMVGLTKGAVRWDDGGGSRAGVLNPWNGGGGAAGAAVADGTIDADAKADAAGLIGGGGPSRKGKKGKQVLYKFG